MASSPFYLLLRRALSSSSALPRPVRGLSRDMYRTGDLNEVVKKFLKASENTHFRKKNGIYEEIVKRLSIAGEPSLIREILEEQKKYRDITKEGFCARLISLYGRSRMLADAVKLFDEMPDLKSDRTILSVNAVLGACVSSEMYDQVEGFFRDLPKKAGVEPDLGSYNTLIKAFVKMDQLEKALNMVDEMKKNGYKADIFTYNTLLTGSYAAGKSAQGDEIWDKMIKSGVKPNARSYNVKLLGYTSGDKTQQAFDLVEEMKQKGLSPDKLTYNLLIKVCCNEGNLTEALKWYCEMRRQSKPDIRTYGKILPLVCQKGDLDLAIRLCHNILKDRCVVDGAVLQKVVDLLVEGCKLEEAGEIVKLASGNKYCSYKLKIPEKHSGEPEPEPEPEPNSQGVTGGESGLDC